MRRTICKIFMGLMACSWLASAAFSHDGDRRRDRRDPLPPVRPTPVDDDFFDDDIDDSLSSRDRYRDREPDTCFFTRDRFVLNLRGRTFLEGEVIPLKNLIRQHCQIMDLDRYNLLAVKLLARQVWGYPSAHLSVGRRFDGSVGAYESRSKEVYPGVPTFFRNQRPLLDGPWQLHVDADGFRRGRSEMAISKIVIKVERESRWGMGGGWGSRRW